MSAKRGLAALVITDPTAPRARASADPARNSATKDNLARAKAPSFQPNKSLVMAKTTIVTARSTIAKMAHSPKKAAPVRSKLMLVRWPIRGYARHSKSLRASKRKNSSQSPAASCLPSRHQTSASASAARPTRQRSRFVSIYQPKRR